MEKDENATAHKDVSKQLATPEQLATLKYKTGDAVLCYEPDPKKKQVLYHARIMEIEFEDINQYLGDLDEAIRREVSVCGVNVQPMFYIHFLNWGPKYNRWVMKDMILDVTEENLITKAELDGGVKNPRKRQDSETTKISPCSDIDNIQDSEKSQEDVGLNFTLPVTIKQSLERDYVNIKLRNLIVRLPRTPNVRDILSLWAERTVSENKDNEGLVEEFVDGITTYFDFMLPLQLLYKEEKLQYEQDGIVHGQAKCRRQQLTLNTGNSTLLYPGYKEWGDRASEKVGPIKPSTLYGIEHLLRLFVNLPQYLEHIPETFLPTLSLYCNIFMDYVVTNKAEVFVEIQPYEAIS